MVIHDHGATTQTLGGPHIANRSFSWTASICDLARPVRGLTDVLIAITLIDPGPRGSDADVKAAQGLPHLRSASRVLRRREAGPGPGSSPLRPAGAALREVVLGR